MMQMNRHEDRNIPEDCFVLDDFNSFCIISNNQTYSPLDLIYDVNEQM